MKELSNSLAVFMDDTLQGALKAQSSLLCIE